jgi:hypothetical protein
MTTHANHGPGSQHARQRFASAARRVRSVSDCTLRCNRAASVDGEGCRVAVLRSAIVVFGVLLMAVIPANAVDLDQLTVVTLARDGSWGVARAGSQGPAIAAAIRTCRAMAGTASDCGAQFTTVRSGWVIASLCGGRKIVVAAETREAAEQAMLLREYNLKPLHGPDMPPCRRVVTVNPTGATVTPERQDLGEPEATLARP